MTKHLNSPATRWGEAFPLGNGQIGAMVFGGYGSDQIILTENTFFSGCVGAENNQPGAADAFYQMRREILDEDYESAHLTAEHFIGRRENYGTNLPVGTIRVESSLKGGRAEQYDRQLVLQDGIVCESYRINDCSVKTKSFASHPDHMLVCMYQMDRPVDLTVSFDAYCEGSDVVYNKNHILFQTEARETMHCDNPGGVMLWGDVYVETDGDPRVGEPMYISHAQRMVLMVRMKTDFAGEVQRDATPCFSDLPRRDDTLSDLLSRHTADVNQLMNRCTLNLSGHEDLAYEFTFGRYLLLCASREDSVLPAHLQGIWNDNVACRIGWTCDMHLDINTQMNYWPAEVTNLAGTTDPLFRWIREKLVPHGRISAKNNYHLDGWVAEIVSNAWGFTAPYWAVPISPYPTGGVWILTHMWEHYQYTKDQAFLRKAFPVIEEAVLFFTEYVFETEDGTYSCGPSISAENSFVKDGITYFLSCGCTGEILMIRELFDIYEKAHDVLANDGLESDGKLLGQVRQIKSKLLPYRVLPDGTVAEWAHDYPAADPQHRHTSHLLGLFPFSQITSEKTPKLAKAAEKTIQKKLTPPENWEDTGWARSMLMLYEARLWHGDEAGAHIMTMMDELLEPNGMIIHPPTRGAGSFANVYEMDGNTGLTSCIAEMLLQSHDDVIRLLPALPADWKSGHVTGLCARGGVSVELEWNEGTLTQAAFFSDQDCDIIIKYKDKTRNVHVRKGVRASFM